MPTSSLLLADKRIILYTSKYPGHTVALDVLQSKNAVAQVILLSYHSLPLVKVT